MAHWLLKSEPAVYGIDDLRRDGRTGWDGVRNYQARNAMRAMAVGDLALFYHSNASPPGVAGVAKVVRTAYPDPTQWDRDDAHFDPRSTPERPLWDQVDVAFVEAFPAVLPLDTLRHDPVLAGMVLLSGKAMRLSVQPVEKRHFDRIVKMGRAQAPAKPAKGAGTGKAAPKRAAKQARGQKATARPSPGAAPRSRARRVPR